jgi:hypothetical protein
MSSDEWTPDDGLAWLKRDAASTSSAPHTLQTHMLAWQRDTGEVKAIAHPANDGARGWYTTGACTSEIANKPFAYRQAQLFVEAWHIVLRGEATPLAIHQALLAFAEYRDALNDQLLWLDPCMADDKGTKVPR